MRLSHETIKLLVELGDKEAAEVFKDVSQNPNIETHLVSSSLKTGWFLSKGMAYILAYHTGGYSCLFRAVTIEN